MKIKKILSFLMSVSLSVSVLPSVVSFAANNVGVKPVDWYFSNNTGTGICIVTDEKAHGGQCSMLVTNGTGYAPGMYQDIFYYVNVEEGKTYELGCWAKGVGVTGAVMGVDWGSQVNITPFYNFDWIECRGKFTAAKTGRSSVQIRLTNKVEKLYIDDLFMYELDASGNRVGENIFNKTGFELDDSDVTYRAPKLSEQQKKMLEIREKGVSPKSYVEAVYTMLQSIPVFKSKAEVDTYGEEWENVASVSMPDENSVNTVKEYKGSEDLSFDFKMAHDDDNFYLYAVRLDDTDLRVNDAAGVAEYELQVMYAGAAQYKGKLFYVDSIQFALSDGTNTYEFGTVHEESGTKLQCFSGNADEEALSKAKVQTRKSGKVTYYEFAIPWDIMFGDKPESVLFDIMSNDNDGSGKIGYISLGGAIGQSVNTERCKRLQLKENSDFYQIVEDTEDEKEATFELNYNYYIVNNTSNERAFTLSLPQSEPVNLTVPANSVCYRKVPVKFDTAGSYNLTFSATDSISGASETSEITAEITDLYVSLEKYKKRMEVMESETLPALIKLRDEANDKGITTQYEDITINVLEQQIPYMLEDIRNKVSYHLDYNVGALERMAKEAETAIRAYMDGTKTPLTSPQFKTSYVTRQGVSEFAQTESGEIRPTFFIGYGHFSNLAAEMPKLNDYGANFIQNEIPTQEVIRINDKGELYVNMAYVNSLEARVKSAAEHNVQFDFQLPVHYVSLIPDINKHYTDFTWNSQIVKDVMSLLYETVIPIMVKYDSIHSFSISNEPASRLRNIESNLIYYRDWLKSTYDNDISALNKNYQTSYASFEEITIPEEWYTGDKYQEAVGCLNPDTWELGTLNAYMDWTKASRQSNADFHNWMADSVRKLAPGIPVHFKVVCPMLSEDGPWARHYLLQCMDMEMLTDAYDLNGNDACNFPRRGQEILDKMAWYDYLMSLKKAPVINSEDHIVLDRDIRYNEEYKYHYYTDMWQGAIHGRANTAIWVWGRDHSFTATQNGSGIIVRPDCIEAVAKSQLDLNRLAYEVTALQNVEPEVAIYYNFDVRLRNTQFERAMNLAYSACTYSGQRVHYMTNAQIKKYALEDYKIVFLPEVNNMDNELLKYFEEYVRKGGKLVIMGRDTLAQDMYGRPTDERIRQYLFDNALVVDTEGTDENSYLLVKPTYEELFPVVYNLFDSLGMQDVKVIDNETNLPVFGCEINETVYNGKRLVNIVNYYEDVVKDVRIEVNGQPIESAVNRFTEETVDCKSIKLKLNDPVFLEF